MPDGVLVLDKPAGWTSHDVVARVRGILKEKKTGHLGTLDPLATGVLPLALGAATRLIEFSHFSKEYEAVCLLGRVTDSLDVTGRTLRETATQGFLPEKVRQAVLELKAVTEQKPPMVSAVKQGGRKLYDLARRGLTVERNPRPVTVENIEVLSIDLPRASFRVLCSPGTYVRSLCDTLGENLGVGGCLEALRRIRVGPFKLNSAVTLETIQQEAGTDRFTGRLLPAGSLVEHLPAIQFDGTDIRSLCQGKKLSAQGSLGWVRVLNPQGRLSLMAEVGPDGVLSPRKVFGEEGIHS